MIWILWWPFSWFFCVCAFAEVPWRSWAWFPDWHGAGDSLTHLQHIWFYQLFTLLPDRLFCQPHMVHAPPLVFIFFFSLSCAVFFFFFLERKLLLPYLPPSQCEKTLFLDLLLHWHLVGIFVQSDDSNSYINTLMAVAAVQIANQNIRSSFEFSILPKDTLICRPRESNQRPSNNKMLALPLSHSCPKPHCDPASSTSELLRSLPQALHLHHGEPSPLHKWSLILPSSLHLPPSDSVKPFKPSSVLLSASGSY